MSVRVYLICAILLMSGCGTASKVNSSKSFESTWEAQVAGLLGGAPEKGTIELVVDGSKFFYHKKQRFGEFSNDGTKTLHYVVESDVVYDGTAIYEFNSTTTSEEDPSSVEKSKVILLYEPDSDFLANNLFWKIPKDLPTKEEGTEEVEGTKCLLLSSRQMSALGGDAVYRFYIDPVRWVLLKRSDSIGEDSSGSSKESVLGTVFTCKELKLNPTIESGKFTKPEGEVETIPKFSWL